MPNTNKDRKRLSDRTREKNSRKKTKGIFTLPLVVFLLIASIGIIAYNVYTHTYFKVSQVFVSGNMISTDEEILKVVGNPVGKSIFTYDAKKGEKILLEQDTITEAKIIKKYPDNIYIDLKEIYPFMETSYKNKTYIIANNGEILEATESTGNLVEYEGEIESTKLGDFFTKDQEKLTFIQNIQRYSYSKDLEELNLENDDDIGIIIKGIQVDFGSIDKSDYKLKLLDSVLKDIDQKGKKAKKIDLTKGASPVVEVKDESLNEENN